MEAESALEQPAVFLASGRPKVRWNLIRNQPGRCICGSGTDARVVHRETMPVLVGQVHGRSNGTERLFRSWTGLEKFGTSLEFVR